MKFKVTFYDMLVPTDPKEVDSTMIEADSEEDADGYAFDYMFKTFDEVQDYGYSITKMED